MSSIAENLSHINERIRAACLRRGRSPEEVRIVGVTKTVPVERIREGVEAGITILGENYIQEAGKKIEALSGLGVSLHFIGHLQSNKAKQAVELFDCIETVDTEGLALAIDRRALKRGKRTPVLLQVNVGGEASKSGAAPERAVALHRFVSKLEGLIVKGLMTLPPYDEDPEKVRPHFRTLKRILERLRDESPNPEELIELSMGMSGDFEAAVEEGATLVRIGTALFGSRSN